MKLNAEVRVLELQLSRWGRGIDAFKALAGVSAVVGAVVAIVAMLVSAHQWQESQDRDRQTRVEERLDKTLERLGDPAPTKRLSAVVSLRSFLTREGARHHEQVLTSLTNLLALEPEPMVGSAVVAMLTSVEPGSFAPGVLEASLGSLAKVSRALVAQGNLLNRDALQNRPADIVARAQSVAAAIAAMVRLGVRITDLSGIYCVGCKFGGVSLNGVRFNNADLYLADFSNAGLQGASFDGADLEGSRFVAADLRQARLTHSTIDRLDRTEETYVTRRFQKLSGQPVPIIEVSGPNFNCADLRGAVFSGQPIFAFVSTKAVIHRARFDTPALWVKHTTFVKADLQGADFSGVGFFGAGPESATPPFPVRSKQLRSDYPGVAFFEGELSNDSPGATFDPSYGVNLDVLRGSLAATNWTKAILPRPLQEWLKANQPPSYSGSSNQQPCEPRSARSQGQ